MAVTRLLSLLFLVVLAQGSVGPSSNGSLCTESRECLQYQLLCQTDEYEVRHYSPTLWVSTDAEAYFMGVGAAMAFRRLFQYITGENEGGFQIDMTAPVLVKIPEETTMWEPAIYTLSFPLPQAFQEKPPEPTNDKLYFTQMPDMDVYVRSYGGWMLSVTSRLQAHQLTKELDRVGAKYNNSHHYGVGYDSPLKLLNRHNEVWYVCEGRPVCTDPQEPTPPHPLRPRAEYPAHSAPSSAPFFPSPQPTEDHAPSSPQALPIALALSAATERPSEESAHANSSLGTPYPSESTSSPSESISNPSESAPVPSEGTPNPTHGAPNTSEDDTQTIPDSSDPSTQSALNTSEQSSQAAPDTSEQGTQSPPSPSEGDSQGTTNSTEKSTHSAPSLTEESTHNTPNATEKSA